MKKRMLVMSLLILVVFLAGLFANGNSEQEPAMPTQGITKTSPEEKVTLRFSWWGSNARHQATLSAINLYQERHPNVTIEGEYGAFGDYYQKLLTQLAGKTAPDIITVDYKWVSDLMNQGTHFLNMNDLTGLIDMQGFDMDFARIYGGKGDFLIGLPVGMNGMGYLYNVQFLEKYGITPSDEWTWDTLIANGKKVHSTDPSKYLLYNNSEHWMYLFKAMLKQLSGNNVVNDDYSLGFTREQLLQVYSYVKKLVETKTVPPFNEGVLYENVYADQNPNWLNQNFGIFPTSSSILPGIANASNFALSTFRYPVMQNAKNPGILVTPSMFLTISKESKHPDIAADFINFMLNDSEAIAILKDTRGIPCNSVAKDQLVAANIIPESVSDMVAQAITGAGSAENGPSLNPEVIALIKDYIQQVGYGKITPEQATDDFTKELTNLVKTIH